MNQARVKVLKDVQDVKRGEAVRMLRDHDEWWWKFRAYSIKAQYWIHAFPLEISILIWIITGDYWKALAFYGVVAIYHTAGNLRGLFLHVEHFIEWYMKKTI